VSPATKATLITANPNKTLKWPSFGCRNQLPENIKLVEKNCETKSRMNSEKAINSMKFFITF